MQTFKEFSFQDEAVTMATRMKMKAAMRKNKAKIKLGRKKAAKKLFIAPVTVRVHVKNILTKMELKTLSDISRLKEVLF